MKEQQVLEKLEAKLGTQYATWTYERMQPTKQFILARSKQWAEVIGMPYYEIIDKWLCMCNYSMINYFQNANQPELDTKTHIFDTKDNFIESLKGQGFRCPACGGVSKSPCECDSGNLLPKSKKVCDWKSYGFFGCMGKGVFVFVKEDFKYATIFKPIAWEVL